MGVIIDVGKVLLQLGSSMVPKSLDDVETVVGKFVSKRASVNLKKREQPTYIDECCPRFIDIS